MTTGRQILTDSTCSHNSSKSKKHKTNGQRSKNDRSDLADTVPYFDVDINVDVDVGSSERLLSVVAQEQVKSIVATLYPRWSNLNFEIFTNGITNKIFCVTNGRQNSDENKLIFRVYGRGTSNLIDRERELHNMTLLSAHNIAAPLLGKFRNGVVCGYLDGHCLDVDEVRQPHIVEKICHAMAKMHRIPCTETEPFLFTKLAQYFEVLPSSFFDVTKQQIFNDYFIKNGIDLQKDVQLLRQKLEQLSRRVDSNEISSRIVFCHNDLLVYNILYDSRLDKIHFIDYEYAAANYQLFDLANHFCEYAGVNNTDYTRCPDDNEKRQFVRQYLRCYDGCDPSDNQMDSIIKDIRIFEAASHLFWCVWALAQSHFSTIDFNYLQYAILRYKQFSKII